jgi:hypothetical protein
MQWWCHFGALGLLSLPLRMLGSPHTRPLVSRGVCWIWRGQAPVWLLGAAVGPDGCKGAHATYAGAFFSSSPLSPRQRRLSAHVEVVVSPRGEQACLQAAPATVPADSAPLANPPMRQQLYACSYSQLPAETETWSAQVRQRAASLDSLVASIAALDVAAARAKHARWLGATRPALRRGSNASASSSSTASSPSGAAAGAGAGAGRGGGDEGCKLYAPGARHPVLMQPALSTLPYPPSVRAWVHNFFTHV